MKLTFYIIIIFCLNPIVMQNDILVNTTSGNVVATKSKNVLIFEDIPYAQPPVGNLRWKAPKLFQSPVKIFPKENNFCVQRPSNLGGSEETNFMLALKIASILDVFVPKKKLTENIPVMFWIHGGGNTSGLKDLYDYSKMVSRHDVIVVRINYRLGPFGWFTHPSIQEFQIGEDKTSNFGTLDIIMALKWVQ